MPTCNTFELSVSLTGSDYSIVEYSLHSDLPAGTQVILSSQRTYQDLKGELSLWVGYGERITLTPDLPGSCGCRGRIAVVESDAKALEHFRQINNSFPPGISSRVSDTLTIVFTVGGRQRLREFGRNNVNLSGRMVSQSGDINIVEAEGSILAPLKPEFQPVATSTDWSA